jgi:hypothetical protein
MAKNVLETYPLYDSLGIVNDLATWSIRPQGWFPSFNLAGQSAKWEFFNQRNIASAGIEFCNLDTRDQIAWPFSLEKLNVHFFGPSMVFQRNQFASIPIWDWHHSPLWECEIPKHCGLTLNINQDCRLRLNALMPGAGGGPVAGGLGSLGAQPGNTGGNLALASQGQGTAHVSTSYKFPEPIGIPVKAAISVSIEPSEYARQLLQAITVGPGFNLFQNLEESAFNLHPAFFGIRVTLHGTRQMQQRGEAHAR